MAADNRPFRTGLWLFFVLVSLLFHSRLAAAQDLSAQLGVRLEELSTGRVQDIGGKPIAARRFLPKLYAALAGRVAWSRQENVLALAAAVARTWEDGLAASDFHAEFVKAEAAKPTSGIERDILLSDALARLLYQLYFGKVDPNGIDRNWNFTKPILDIDPARAIAEALSSGDAAWLIEPTRLKHPLYIELKALLQQYTNFDVTGGWGTIPSGPALKPGQSDPRISALRTRLPRTGEYEATAAGGDLFDERLVSRPENVSDASWHRAGWCVGTRESCVTQCPSSRTRRTDQGQSGARPLAASITWARHGGRERRRAIPPPVSRW